MAESEMKWLEPSCGDEGNLCLKPSKPPPDPRSVRGWIRLLAVPGFLLCLLMFGIEVWSLLKNWPFKAGDGTDWRAIGNHVVHIFESGSLALFLGFCVFRGRVPQWVLT